MREALTNHLAELARRARQLSDKLAEDPGREPEPVLLAEALVVVAKMEAKLSKLHAAVSQRSFWSSEPAAASSNGRKK